MTEQGQNGGDGKRPNRRRLAEARRTTATRRSARPQLTPAHEALQETLDGLVEDLRFTQKMVDGLTVDKFWRDTMVGRIPNEWVRLRDHYREQVGHLALSIEAKGIAERGVRVKEAQAVMMAQMIRQAAERAGLEPAQVNALGDELRKIAAEVGT